MEAPILNGPCNKKTETGRLVFNENLLASFA